MRGFLGVPTFIWIGLTIGLFFGLILPLPRLTLKDNVNCPDLHTGLSDAKGNPRLQCLDLLKAKMRALTLTNNANETDFESKVKEDELTIINNLNTQLFVEIALGLIISTLIACGVLWLLFHEDPYEGDGNMR